jgi:hypothetical protein
LKVYGKPRIDDQNAAWSFGIPMFLNMMFATAPTVT